MTRKMEMKERHCCCIESLDENLCKCDDSDESDDSDTEDGKDDQNATRALQTTNKEQTGTTTATTKVDYQTNDVTSTATAVRTFSTTQGLLQRPSGSDSPSSSASAVIAGAVVGGLVAMILLAMLFYFWSQRSKRLREASDKTNNMKNVETSSSNDQGAAGYNIVNEASTNREYAEISDDSGAKAQVADNEYSRLDMSNTGQKAYDMLHNDSIEGKGDGCSSTLKPAPEYFVLEGATNINEKGSVDEISAPYFVLESESIGGDVPSGNKAPDYFVLEVQNPDSSEQPTIKSPEYFVLENETGETVGNEGDVGPAPNYFVLQKDMPQ